MIFDGIPFSQVNEVTGGNPFRKRAISSFVSYIERKLGVFVGYEARNVPFGRINLIEQFELATSLKKNGVLSEIMPIEVLPDEPPFKSWLARCEGGKHAQSGGGSDVFNDTQALTATLAEALERYIWAEEDEHFISPLKGSESEVGKHGYFISPQRFAGFTDEQRKRPELRLDADSSYTWVRGMSLVNGKKVYIPAQTVSGVRFTSSVTRKKEQLIRTQVTNGLATAPTKADAQLRGAMEVIERDAYMILWLNQLTLPRISLSQFKDANDSLAELLARCERYRLKVHAISLITDAPTHAACVVVEDESDLAPRFSVGLRAHRSLRTCIEKALLEALRARAGYRRFFSSKNSWDPQTPPEKIGHGDRFYYWAEPVNAPRLEFLIRGKEQEHTPREWENDTPEAHLKRIVEWCRDREYEFISVPLTRSKKNCTPWHIEMVVIPELQPLHLSESCQQLGGKRLKEIPLQFGFKTRNEPFAREPHPFV